MESSSRIYFVRKTNVPAIHGKMHGEIIAKFNLGNVGDMYCFDMDSDYCITENGMMIFEDGCGDPLRECTIERLIEWFDSMNDEKKYNNVKKYVSELLEIYDSEEIAVVYYGY